MTDLDAARHHPLPTPGFRMVADVEAEYLEVRYLCRLFVTTERYDGPEYKLELYDPAVFVAADEDGPDIPRSISKVPFVKRSSTWLYLHRGEFEVLQEIYVVHHTAFLTCKLFYLEGMTGIYAIQGEDYREHFFHMRHNSNTAFRKHFMGEYLFGYSTYWEKILNVNRPQYLYLFRMGFLKNVQSSLRAMKGCGSFSFDMENCRVEFMRYIYELASGSFSTFDHEPEYQHDKPGKTTRLLLDNAILPQQSPKDVVVFRIMDVECLIPAFGASWYYHPITEHNHISGDFMSSKYSCIPHVNSNITIGLDINSMVMRCTVPAIALHDQQSTLEGIAIFKTKLDEWRGQLIGFDFLDPEDGMYYHVVNVEHNMHGFVDRKRRSLAYSCCVAWLACYNDFEIDEEPQLIEQSKSSSEVREEHCYPFLPEDVLLFLRVDMTSVPASAIAVNRPCKKLRKMVEMPDDSGLDLETFVFKKKDRTKMRPCEQRLYDDEAIAVKIHSMYSLEAIEDDMSILGMLRYALKELLLEAHCAAKDFYGRLVVALDHPAYNVEDLQKLFLNEKPFNCGTSDEDQSKLLSFTKKQKRKLLEYAVKRWCEYFASN